MKWHYTSRLCRWYWVHSKQNIPSTSQHMYWLRLCCIIWSCVSHPTHGAAAGWAHGIFTDCCDLGAAAHVFQAIIESKTTAHTTHMVMEIMCAPDLIMATPLEPMVQWQALPWHLHCILVFVCATWDIIYVDYGARIDFTLHPQA